MNNLKKAKKICIIYGTILAILYSLGSFVLSNGWSCIDGSNFRVFLYILAVAVIPITVVIAIVHVSYSLFSKKTFKQTVIVSLFLGFIGPLTLLLAIHSSSDGEAEMAYLGIFISYCVLFVTIFFLLCSFLSMKKVYLLTKKEQNL